VNGPNISARRKDWLRWAVVGALFAITVINYVDRQSLSLLAPVMQRQMNVSDQAYGHIVSAFLVAYSLAYVFAGRLCDKLGTRAGMTLFVVWWSVAEILPIFARTGMQLGGGRFLLGLGEAGNYVAAPKAVREWFPAEERALALGIYTAGATLGATLAPPLIAGVSGWLGWRMVFVVTGLAGLVWVAPWLWIMRRKPPVLVAEPEVVAEGGSVWRDVLTSRTTWLLLGARFLTDPVWYFFLFWFPKYLGQVRGLSLAQTGHTAWVVYLAADVGTLAGGWICGPMIRRGMAPLTARRKVMTYAAILMPLSPLAALLPTLNGSLAIASIMALAHMSWLVMLTTIVLDHFPASRVATAAGVIAGGSGLGGLLSAEILGQVIPGHGYTPIFWAMGLLHPLALLLVWRLRTPRKTEFVATELSGACA
jgi:ACS family hexuronate transporter-like MFS transporter